MPFFSVIIPTYNRVDLLPRCLDSVLSQTFSDFEIIVVDNFSLDGTKELLNAYIQKDHRVSYIQERNNGVIAHSRNVGIREAKSEYICLLDSDDWFRKDKLELAYQCIEKFNSDLVYHPLVVVSKNGEQKSLGKPLTWGNKYLELLIEGDKICNSSVVVRKSVLEAIGYICEDTELVAVEDFDCWLRIAKAGCKITYSSIPAGYYWEGDNFSASDKQVIKIHSLYKRHLTNVPMEYRKIVEIARDYRKARIYHSINRFSDARNGYIEIFWNSTIKMKLKLLILIILTLIKK